MWGLREKREFPKFLIYTVEMGMTIRIRGHNTKLLFNVLHLGC